VRSVAAFDVNPGYGIGSSTGCTNRTLGSVPSQQGVQARAVQGQGQRRANQGDGEAMDLHALLLNHWCCAFPARGGQVDFAAHCGGQTVLGALLCLSPTGLSL
jgi:hypothetical protein